MCFIYFYNIISFFLYISPWFIQPGGIYSAIVFMIIIVRLLFLNSSSVIRVFEISTVPIFFSGKAEVRRINQWSQKMRLHGNCLGKMSLSIL